MLCPFFQPAAIWMPDAGSTYAGEVDGLFYALLWITTVVFLSIVVWLAAMVWRYHGQPGGQAHTSPAHNTTLELTWTIVPTIIFLAIFYFGFQSFLNIATSPPNPYEINVQARTWRFSFRYPNGHVDANLHVPVDRPVRLVMQSDDVIHSLYIPAFRAKRDVVPYRYNELWFEATRVGEFDLFCAEYCGEDHSAMMTKVIVEDASVFAAWLEEAGRFVTTLPPAEAGKRLFESHGCKGCHRTNGAGGIGPSLVGLFTKQTETLTDDSQVTIDENYIRDSILYPGKHLVKGYDNVMPSSLGRLRDIEITAIIAYLKQLSGIEVDTEPLKEEDAKQEDQQ